MSTLPRILLVDDDETHLLVAQRAIARSGVAARVEVAGSGAEALRRLWLTAARPAAGESIAVVMLDVGLPDISGWDVLARVRRDPRLRTLPVVLVSSSDRPEDVRRGYEAGANSYLVKRHDDEHPGSYLAEAARYWVRLNVPADPHAEPAAAGP